VTPGLLAKANFGVLYRYDVQSIGRPEQLGIRIESESVRRPVQILGSVETMTLLVNGVPVALPAGDVWMGKEALEDVVEVRGSTLEKPVSFRADIERPDTVEEWRIGVFGAAGARVWTRVGTGPAPERIEWDGRDETGSMLAGGRSIRTRWRSATATGAEP